MVQLIKLMEKELLLKPTEETDFTKSGVDIYNACKNLKDQIKIHVLTKNHLVKVGR